MSKLKDLVLSLEAFIFDMDGTIVNTEPLHAKAAVGVLKNLGIEIDLDSCLDQYYGMTDTAVLKAACPTLNDQEIDQAIAAKNIQLLKLFNELAPHEKSQYITPGLFHFLNLIKQEKKQLAVISASEDIIVLETLKCFQISSYIDTHLQMGRNQTERTKPHPDPYLEGMRRLQSDPAKTLIFEDSPTGLQAALASKARVIRITEFAHSPKILHSEEWKNFIW